jgi:hypothetical protein
MQPAADAFSNGGFRYRLQAGVLLQLDRYSEAIIRVHKPFGTNIVQIEPRRSGIIVREDYYQFPRGASNVYLLDYAFRLLWRAVLPAPNDAYAGPVHDHDTYLQCASWECFSCRICPDTGKLLSKEFTK